MEGGATHDRGWAPSAALPRALRAELSSDPYARAATPELRSRRLTRGDARQSALAPRIRATRKVRSPRFLPKFGRPGVSIVAAATL